MTDETLFRASELIDMAVEIEHEGADFYETCARNSSEESVRKVFNSLVGQEHEHARVFESMKEGLEDYTLPESYPGENRSYLRGFVQDKVFSSAGEATEKAEKTEDPLQAVDMALGFEKSSILFYSGMKQLVRASEHDAIDRIINEEHNHIRRLLNLKKNLEQ